MYTVLNVILGPEIEVTFICNESQVHEVVDFISNYEGSAVDIIEAVEISFDCRFVTPQYADPFNWRPAGQPQEFSYCVSVLDAENNPSDNLDNFALLEDAIDYAKNNLGTAVFLEKYNAEKNICEYDLVWHPNDDPPQLVEWKLTVSGYDELSQSDKDLARGIIAKTIEVFNDFAGRFNIKKDEDEGDI